MRMANPYKSALIESLSKLFGQPRKIEGSESLFAVADGAARVYIRYSKVHPGGRTFFGLREVDLRQLEGYNSFVCLLLDDGSQPLFIPYADFEEVFRGAKVASDGQYKVQLWNNRGVLELYVSRCGRFNVEGYAGLRTLQRSLDTSKLRKVPMLSHCQVQTLLAAIGHSKGFDGCLPAADQGKMDWSLTAKFELRPTIPAGFRDVAAILSEIDVVWVARGGNTVEGLFEVEHTTSVYSGLLRFNDIFLTDPKVSRFSIVSDDVRRSRFARQVSRPTFRASGLSEIASFLEYKNVFEWHSRLAMGGAM
jgi:hypothetical protein